MPAIHGDLPMAFMETPCCGMIIDAETYLKGCPVCGRCPHCNRRREERPEFCSRCRLPFCPCCAKCPGCGAYRYSESEVICRCGFIPSPEAVAGTAELFPVPTDLTKTDWAKEDRKQHPPSIRWASMGLATKFVLLCGMIAFVWLLVWSAVHGLK